MSDIARQHRPHPASRTHTATEKIDTRKSTMRRAGGAVLGFFAGLNDTKVTKRVGDKVDRLGEALFPFQAEPPGTTERVHTVMTEAMKMHFPGFLGRGRALDSSIRVEPIFSGEGFTTDSSGERVVTDKYDLTHVVVDADASVYALVRGQTLGKDNSGFSAVLRLPMGKSHEPYNDPNQFPRPKLVGLSYDANPRAILVPIGPEESRDGSPAARGQIEITSRGGVTFNAPNDSELVVMDRRALTAPDGQQMQVIASPELRLLERRPELFDPFTT